MTARPSLRPSPRLLTMGAAAALVVGLLGQGGAADVASASPAAAERVESTHRPAQPRGLRVAPAAETVTAYAYDGYVYLDSPAWLAAYGEGYEFRAQRAKPSAPVTLTKTVIRGTKRTTTKAPASIVDGFDGFKKGLTVQVATAKGKVLAKETRTFCLGGSERQRVEPTGRTEPIYPEFCGGSWFTKSTVFGVEQGWAARIDGYFEVETTQKNLVLTMSISEPVATFLGIPAGNRTLTQKVTVEDECELFECGEVGEQLMGTASEGFSTQAEDALTDRAQGLRTQGGHAAHAEGSGSDRRVNLFTLRDGGQHGDHPALGQAGSKPSSKRPARDTLPDLVSAPAWQIGVEVDEAGTDRLAFNANEWNAGPAPLVVEGYRKGAKEVMDGYQFFYRNGKEVGSTRAGTMEYHAAPEHDH
ncbi:hypothetical protein ACFQHV_19510 [Promicromonospora thailandica]|nr:hypothetical protein [Promicromonospora thailandica]BFF18329.1 hypothetical protein GCM10025730_18500 [Promicromonospora thailandica]